MKSIIILFLWISHMLCWVTAQAQMETIQIDSNCVIYKHPEQNIDKFNSNVLHFGGPELKHSYPKLLENTNINIRQLRISNVSFKNLPIELKAFPSIAFIGLLNCDSNMSKLFEHLSLFPKLDYLSIEGCQFAKFPEKVEKSFNLHTISIVNCDSVYITKEFINKCRPKEIFIDRCKAVTFEKGIVLDSIDSFTLYNLNNSQSLITCENLEDVLNSITKADFIDIGGVFGITFPNNILECRVLGLNGSGLANFVIPTDSKINYFSIVSNNISELSHSFYTHKGYGELDIAENLLRDFRFDLLDTNTFKYKKGIYTVFEEGDSTKGIIEIIPANEYYPEINLSWNFLDSIRTFVDTSLNKSYRIYLNYNNRKLKSDSDGLDSLKYKEFNPEKLSFTLPKGIFNLQFRGQLNLIGYNLSEEEKDKIRKHFKYAEVIFEEKKRR